MLFHINGLRTNKKLAGKSVSNMSYLVSTETFNLNSILEFCTSVVSNGSHIALSRHLLSLVYVQCNKLYILTYENESLAVFAAPVAAGLRR